MLHKMASTIIQLNSNSETLGFFKLLDDNLHESVFPSRSYTVILPRVFLFTQRSGEWGFNLPSTNEVKEIDNWIRSLSFTFHMFPRKFVLRLKYFLLSTRQQTLRNILKSSLKPHILMMIFCNTFDKLVVETFLALFKGTAGDIETFTKSNNLMSVQFDVELLHNPCIHFGVTTKGYDSTLNVANHKIIKHFF